jgi:ribosomal protein L37AE/L43A
MAAQQYTGPGAHRCPECDGDVTFDDQSWQCVDCGHAPRHGAD